MSRVLHTSPRDALLFFASALRCTISMTTASTEALSFCLTVQRYWLSDSIYTMQKRKNREQTKKKCIFFLLYFNRLQRKSTPVHTFFQAGGGRLRGLHVHLPLFLRVGFCMVESAPPLFVCRGLGCRKILKKVDLEIGCRGRNWLLYRLCRMYQCGYQRVDCFC